MEASCIFELLSDVLLLRIDLFLLLAVKASLTGLCLVPEFPSLKEIACWQADYFLSKQWN